MVTKLMASCLPAARAAAPWSARSRSAKDGQTLVTPITAVTSTSRTATATARVGVTQAVSHPILPAVTRPLVLGTVVRGTVVLGRVVLSTVVKGFFIELLPS